MSHDMDPDAMNSDSALMLERAHNDQMVAHALGGFPLEACGLFAGDPAGRIRKFYPCHNTAESSKLYTVDPREMLKADRDAQDNGWELVGVMHSHTHTDPYPSPTDVAQAPDPGWHYVIVSLRDDVPMLRSFRIIDGEITEEAVELI